MFNLLGVLSVVISLGLIAVNLYSLLTDSIGVRRRKVSTVKMGSVITRLPGTTEYRRDRYVRPLV